MNTRLPAILSLVATLVVAGCSTVESRIAHDRTAFDSWPPAVQQQVQAGHVNVGFTMDQVRVALGDPDWRYARTTPQGSYEVWGYRDRGPRFSFGVGVGSYGRHSAFGTGVGMTTSPYPDERMRVIFDAYGRVNSVEQVRRGR